MSTGKNKMRSIEYAGKELNANTISTSAYGNISEGICACFGNRKPRPACR